MSCSFPGIIMIAFCIYCGTDGLSVNAVITVCVLLAVAS